MECDLALVSNEKAQRILNSNGMNVNLTQAAEVLQILIKLAEMAFQYEGEEECISICTGEH